MRRNYSLTLEFAFIRTNLPLLDLSQDELLHDAQFSQVSCGGTNLSLSHPTAPDLGEARLQVDFKIRSAKSRSPRAEDLLAVGDDIC